MLDGGWEEGLLFLPSFPSRRDRDSKAWGLRERPILGVCPYVGGRVQAAYYLPSTCLTAPTPQVTVPGSPAYHTPRTHPVLTHPPSSIYTQAQASSPEIIPPLRDGAPPLLLGQVGCLRGGGSTARSGGDWLHSGPLFGCVGVCVCALSSPAARLPGDPPRHQQPGPPPLPRPQPPRHGHFRAPPPPTPACFAETQTQEILGRGSGRAGQASGNRQSGWARPAKGWFCGQSALVFRPASGLCFIKPSWSTGFPGRRADSPGRWRLGPGTQDKQAGAGRAGRPLLCPLSHLGTNSRPGNVLLLK